ncbi:MAG TPA: hypothetical protein VF691_22730, partial [Cytophagaceae bacterium]
KATIPVLNFSAGFNLFRTFEKMDIGLGLTLSLNKEKFDYDYTYSLIDSSRTIRRDTIDTYYNIKGRDTTYFYVIETKYQTLFKSRIQSLNIKDNNTSLFLDIPILLKYKIIDKKVGVKILASLSPTILVSIKGKTISKESFSTTVRDLSKKDISLFSVKGGIGMEVSYDIGKDIKLLLSSSYSIYITSITSKDLPFTLRRNNISFQAGLQFGF